MVTSSKYSDPVETWVRIPLPPPPLKKLWTDYLNVAQAWISISSIFRADNYSINAAGSSSTKIGNLNRRYSYEQSSVQIAARTRFQQDWDYPNPVMLGSYCEGTVSISRPYHFIDSSKFLVKTPSRRRPKSLNCRIVELEWNLNFEIWRILAKFLER